MRLPALILVCLSALLPSAAAAQATLNKCIDAEGRVTYSNLPCRGAREVQRIEVDPPVQATPRPAPAPVQAPAPVPVPAPAPQAPSLPGSSAPPAAISAQPASVAPPAAPVAPPPARPVAPLEPPARPAAAPASAAPVRPAKSTAIAPRACDAMVEQLGRILDKLDSARRTGAAPEQLEAWNREIQDIERKKKEAGCF